MHKRGPKSTQVPTIFDSALGMVAEKNIFGDSHYIKINPNFIIFTANCSKVYVTTV